MAALTAIVSRYCREKNLIESAYWEGLLSKGELSDELILRLVAYHKEWLGK
jgi:hypothetical protein